jgi:putative addiction module killer protein
MTDIRHYHNASDVDVYQEWLDGIRDRSTRVRITRRVDRIKDGNFGDHEPCRDGVYELKMDFGPGYRVYYSKVGETLVLLIGGGDKSTQDKDIDKAVANLQDYKRRNK